MPLLNHFHPPLYPARQWRSFLLAWCAGLAEQLGGSKRRHGRRLTQRPRNQARIAVAYARSNSPYALRNRSPGSLSTNSAGNSGSLLRARLEREGKRLALFGDDDRTAHREYIRQFLLDDSGEAGKRYNLAHAERFYYMDLRQPSGSKADEYVEKHAVRL